MAMRELEQRIALDGERVAVVQKNHGQRGACGAMGSRTPAAGEIVGQAARDMFVEGLPGKSSELGDDAWSRANQRRGAAGRSAFELVEETPAWARNNRRASSMASSGAAMGLSWRAAIAAGVRRALF